METLSYVGCLLLQTSFQIIKENKEIKVTKNIKKMPF